MSTLGRAFNRWTLALRQWQMQAKPHFFYILGCVEGMILKTRNPIAKRTAFQLTHLTYHLAFALRKKNRRTVSQKWIFDWLTKHIRPPLWWVSIAFAFEKDKLRKQNGYRPLKTRIWQPPASVCWYDISSFRLGDLHDHNQIGACSYETEIKSSNEWDLRGRVNVTPLCIYNKIT